MYYEIVPSMKCFRCCFFHIDDNFDCFCFLVGRDISDGVLSFPFDCICFVPDDNLIRL